MPFPSLQVLVIVLYVYFCPICPSIMNPFISKVLRHNALRQASVLAQISNTGRTLLWSESNRSLMRSWTEWCSIRANVKLGGINCTPVPRAVPLLSDPANPCIVMGEWTITYVIKITQLAKVLMYNILHPVRRTDRRLPLLSGVLTSLYRNMLRRVHCKLGDRNLLMIWSQWLKYVINVSTSLRRFI